MSDSECYFFQPHAVDFDAKMFHSVNSEVHSWGEKNPRIPSAPQEAVVSRWCALRWGISYRNLCHSRIISTKSLSFCMATFSASLTNFAALLPESRDCSCYVSRPILAPPPHWLLKHTALRAHDFAHSWYRPGLADVICDWRWRLCGISSPIQARCRNVVVWLP